MRFAALDGLRGFCALCVALFHLHAYGHFYHLAFVRNSDLFVDFFFVLSGFVLSAAYFERLSSPLAVEVFVVRRFGRMVPLHLATLTAFVILELVKLAVSAQGVGTSTAAFTGSKSTESLLANLAMLHSMNVTDRLSWNFPSWSIGAEFYVNIFFAVVVLAIALWRSRLFEYYSLVLIALLSLALLVVFSPKGIRASYDYGFLRCVYGFFCGVVTQRIFKQFAWGQSSSWPVLEPLVVALAVAFICALPESTYSWLAFATPILFSVVVFILALERGPTSRLLKTFPFRMLGEISFSIYLVHALVLSYLIVAPVYWIEKVTKWKLTGLLEGGGIELNPGEQQGILLGSQLQCDLLALVYLGIVVGLAVLSYRLIEVPGRNFFNGLGSRIAARKQIYRSTRTDEKGDVQRTGMAPGE